MKRTIGRAGVVALVVAVIGGIGASASIAEPPPDNPNKACPAPHPGKGIPPFCDESPTTPGGNGGATIVALFVAPGEGPRGIWCVGSSPLILINAGGGSTIFQPKTAVDLLIAQGKEVEAKGVVTPAFWVPGVGAVCSGYAGVSYTADQPLTKVNNLGQSLVGDSGAIYVLGHKA